ncbi:MAG: hypothetical protein ABII81_12135 [Pseudomonadota bacterium]
MIKVSDLKALFGHTSLEKPLFRRVDSGPQEKVPGVRSEKLKFRTRLCAYCNNTRTQAHDKSWEALAAYLRARKPLIRPGEVVRTTHAFTNGVRPGLLGVHLYFAKLTGCLVLDGGVPLETRSLAEAILQNRPHPNLYLSFLVLTSRRIQRHAFVTPVHTITIDGNLSGVQWFYFVGRIGVHVTYANALHNRKKHVHLWHPSDSEKTITLEGL